jgi:hypothetical protein
MLQSLLANKYLWASSLTVFLFLGVALLVLSKGRAQKFSYIQSINVLVLSIGVFLALCSIFYEFMVDDVYISLRYARNLARGHGLVFSTDGSAPVEGYTNFLWVILETPLFLLGMSDAAIINAIKLIGIGFGTGVLIFSFLLIREIAADNVMSSIGVLFLACVPELALWAVGGLETPMYIFWLVAGVYQYIREKRKGRLHIVSMIFFALMALTRPEGLFFAIAIAGWDVIGTLRNTSSPKNFKPIVVGTLAFLVIYGCYFFWRYNFYGLPLPNSYYAKRLASSAHILHRLKQLSSFIVQLFPFFSVACFAYIALRRNGQNQNLVVVFACLVLMSFSLIARNEWMPGYRYELPFIPFLMILFSVGMATIFHSFDIPRIIKFAALFFLGFFMLYRFNDVRKQAIGLSRQLQGAHVPLGKWMKKYAPENASYASWDMGAVPYYSELRTIIDINSEGLLNPHTTRKGYDVDHMFSLNPSFIVLPPNTSYVQPPDILAFYKKEKLYKEYDYLFSVSFSHQYLLRLYKHKQASVSTEALEEGKRIEAQTRSFYTR